MGQTVATAIISDTNTINDHFHHKYVLTLGYIREVAKEHKLYVVKEIKEIIYAYHRCKDTWNKKYMPSGHMVQFEEYNNKITVLSKSYHSFYGDLVLKEGSYTWRLKLIKRPTALMYGENDQSPFIGFIRDQDDILNQYQHSKDWYIQNGYIYCGGDTCCGFNNTFSYNIDHNVAKFNTDGDILDITLDLTKQIISLSVNQGKTEIPKVFTSIKKDKYRLVVTIHGVNTSIQLL
eukprot:194079_1